jgi:hypothetical protein
VRVARWPRGGRRTCCRDTAYAGLASRLDADTLLPLFVPLRRWSTTSRSRATSDLSVRESQNRSHLPPFLARSFPLTSLCYYKETTPASGCREGEGVMGYGGVEALLWCVFFFPRALAFSLRHAFPHQTKSDRTTH